MNKKLIYSGMFSLLLMTSAGAMAADASKNKLPSILNSSRLGVERMIMQFRDGAPTTIPQLLDPGHTQMLALGAPNNIFTPTDVNNYVANSISYILANTGLDFTNITPDPVEGIYYMFDNEGNLYTMLLPFVIGLDGSYNVYSDSSDPLNLANPKQVINFSMIVYFAQSGQIPNGQTFNAGDLFTGGGYDIHVSGPAGLWKWYNETFTLYSEFIGQEPVNSLGQTEVHVTVVYYDKNGNRLEGSDNVYIFPGNDGERQLTYHILCQLQNPIQSLKAKKLGKVKIKSKPHHIIHAKDLADYSSRKKHK